MPLLDAAIHAGTNFQRNRLTRNKDSQIVSRIQGWTAHAIHTSGHTIAGDSLFPMTGLTTVASRPCWEKLRFASIAPHNLL